MPTLLSPRPSQIANPGPGLDESAPTMALSYEPASQVTQILHQLTATSTQINQATYAYNPVGNRTSLTDRRGAQAFGYDTLDRLTSASHPLLATPQSFAYDPVGNRTTGGSVVNAGNQLTANTEKGSGVFIGTILVELHVGARITHHDKH
jgi:YD repeat-containing protein